MYKKKKLKKLRVNSTPFPPTKIPVTPVIRAIYTDILYALQKTCKECAGVTGVILVVCLFVD